MPFHQRERDPISMPHRLPLPKSAATLVATDCLVHPALLLNKLVLWHAWRFTGHGKKDPPVKTHAYHNAVKVLGRPEWKELAGAIVSRRHAWLSREHAQGRARLLRLKTLTPLVVNLSGASPLELGLAFHHTYGLPVIPGSALKGIARASSRFGGDDLGLFGEQECAGLIDFLDAVCVEGAPVQIDIMTPHFGKWYQGKGLPDDRDDPNPIHFLSVRPGAVFETALVVRSGINDPGHLLDRAQAALSNGLEELGAGAKTAAGYGVLSVEAVSVAVAAAEAAPASIRQRPAEQSPGERLRREIEPFRGGKDFAILMQKVDACLALEEPDRTEIAKLLVDRMGGLKEVRGRAKAKPKLKELLDAGGFSTPGMGDVKK